MKFFKYAIFILFIFMFTTGVVFAGVNSRVKVLSVSGKVKYLSSKEDVWKELKKNKYLRSGDSVKTGSNSSAELAFDSEKNNIVKINSSAYVVLKLQGSEKIEIINGEVFSLIKRLSQGSSFEIRTPTAICGARGTGWGTKADKKETVISAYEKDSYTKGVGEDGKAMTGETTVKQGFKSVVKRFEKPSKLMKLTDKESKKWDKWKKNIEIRVISKRKGMERLTKDLDKIQGQKERIVDKKVEDRIRKREESTRS